MTRTQYCLTACAVLLISTSLPSQPTEHRRDRKGVLAERRDPLSAEIVVDTRVFSDTVSDVSFSLDGQWSAAADQTELRIWSLQDGSLHTTLRGRREANGLGRCSDVAFSPDGRELVVAAEAAPGEGVIRIYGTTNFQRIAEALPAHTGSPRHLALSRDGTLSTAELHPRVVNRVKERTNGEQHAVYEKRPTIADFDLAESARSRR